MTATGTAEVDPAGLDELIEMLCKAGLQIGPSEAIDAALVMRYLAGSVPPGEQTRSRLKSHLRPVLCKSTTACASYDDVFDRWCNRVAKPGKHVDDTGTTEEKVPAETKKPPYLLVGAVLIMALLALLALLAAVRFWPPQDSGGSGASAPTQSVPAATPAPRATGAAPAAPAARAAAVSSGPAKTYGYFPAVRVNEEIRPAWWWVLVLLPLLAGGPAMLSALPSARISRARGGGQVMLQDWPASKYRRDLVAPIAPAVEARLQRHVPGAVEHRHAYARRPQVDPRRTVAATIGKLGIPTLRYRRARLRPAYLVLVAAERDDAFGILWAQRLRDLDIRVDVFRFPLPDGAAVPICTEVGGTGRRFGFHVLPRPEAGQRLLVLGPTTALVGATRQLHDWARAAQLSRWEQRALFTQDDPRDWNMAHVEVLEQTGGADCGMLVLPLDDNALAAWSEWLVQGRMPPIVLSEPQRYPRLLLKDDARPQAQKHFVGEPGTPPQVTGELASRLVSELQVYLGENGFYWLCACAVPPLLEQRLALLLGEQYFLRCGTGERETRRYMARNWRRLVRLPWLRDAAQMPQWLRLALLARLPQAIQDELRDVVRGALTPRTSAGQGAGFALQFDHPGLPLPHQEPPQLPPLPPAPNGDQRYCLSVGFVRAGLTAEQLLLRIPGAWNQWLPALLQRPPWWRRFGAAILRLTLRDGIGGRGTSRLAMAFAIGTVVLSALGWALIAGTRPSAWPADLQPWLYAEVLRPLAAQHQGALTTVAYSADGSRFVTASRDHTARVWDAATGRPVSAPMPHAGAVRTASFSTDGRHVVTASDDNTARIWDARSGAPVNAPLRHDGVVHTARFSADGRRVVTASADKTARMWDSATGLAVGQTMRLPAAVLSASFSPDDTKVVTVSDDMTATVWYADTGDQGGQFVHRGRIWSAIFSPDSSLLLTASEDRTARAQTAVFSRKNVSVVMPHGDAVLAARFSQDGRRIVTASRDRMARVWDADSGKIIGAPMAHSGAVTAASFSADGQRVVTASVDATARAWDAGTGTPLGEPMRHASAVVSASFSPDGRRVITAAGDGVARVWDGSVKKFLAGPMKHAGLIYSIKFSPDGTRIVTASIGNAARVWDAASGLPVGQPMLHEDKVFSAAFSPDGRLVVTASADGTARVWDASNGAPRSELMSHYQEPVQVARFLADSTSVTTVSNGSLRVWRAGPIQPDAALQTYTEQYDSGQSHALLLENASCFTTVEADGQTRIWDLSTRAPVGLPMKMSQGKINDVSADRTRALEVWNDGVRVWLTSTGRPAGAPMATGVALDDARFSPDGKLVVTVRRDAVARLWDTGSGKQAGASMQHGPGAITVARFSPDGSRVVTAALDGTVRVWDVATSALLGVPIAASGEAAPWIGAATAGVWPSPSVTHYRYCEITAPSNSRFSNAKPAPPLPDKASKPRVARFLAMLRRRTGRPIQIRHCFRLTMQRISCALRKRRRRQAWSRGASIACAKSPHRHLPPIPPSRLACCCSLPRQEDTSQRARPAGLRPCAGRTRHETRRGDERRRVRGHTDATASMASARAARIRAGNHLRHVCNIGTRLCRVGVARLDRSALRWHGTADGTRRVAGGAARLASPAPRSHCQTTAVGMDCPYLPLGAPGRQCLGPALRLPAQDGTSARCSVSRPWLPGRRGAGRHGCRERPAGAVPLAVRHAIRGRHGGARCGAGHTVRIVRNPGAGGSPPACRNMAHRRASGRACRDADPAVRGRRIDSDIGNLCNRLRYRPRNSAVTVVISTDNACRLDRLRSAATAMA
ncbi:WD40 repeat domain-containing protein [Massilia sp. S19_KUP03_FR1]|uniref:WD40 repeat domain-containing protein n=1 Tax=Massilia sp. S19_KUP03_FR1 TaxID=3025503 RepID=UPI002FCD8662